MDIAANRTPLMTSEIVAANHNASLYGYHDSRTTPASYAGENKRLFSGVYDDREYLRILNMITIVSLNVANATVDYDLGTNSILSTFFVVFLNNLLDSMCYIYNKSTISGSFSGVWYLTLLVYLILRVSLVSCRY